MAAVATERALICVAILFLTSGVGAEPAHSSIHVEAASEVSAYHDTDAVNVLTPAARASVRDPLAGWSANGSYLVDIVSAASVDIVSTASPNWVELRHAATLGAKYQPSEIGVGASGAVSSEPDYLSLVGSASASMDLDHKNATFEVGYSYGHDVAWRSDTPRSVYSLALDRHTLSAGVSLVLDRATTLAPTLDVIIESGRQEKPYRYLPLFDAAVADDVEPGASVDEVNRLRLPARMSERVPDHRERVAVSGRLAHRFRNSTLTLFDRAYLDGWGLYATTSDLRWVVELGRRISIWPHFRLHIQSGASFWKRAYVGSVSSGTVVAPEYRSGDRELSPLWSTTLGPGARWDFGALEPRDLSAVVELEVTRTQYDDALYVERRWAGFGLLEFSMRLR